jgi:hypothetical protein
VQGACAKRHCRRRIEQGRGHGHQRNLVCVEAAAAAGLPKSRQRRRSRRCGLPDDGRFGRRRDGRWNSGCTVVHRVSLRDVSSRVSLRAPAAQLGRAGDMNCSALLTSAALAVSRCAAKPLLPDAAMFASAPKRGSYVWLSMSNRTRRILYISAMSVAKRGAPQVRTHRQTDGRTDTPAARRLPQTRQRRKQRPRVRCRGTASSPPRRTRPRGCRAASCSAQPPEPHGARVRADGGRRKRHVVAGLADGRADIQTDRARGGDAAGTARIAGAHRQARWPARGVCSWAGFEGTRD